MSASAPCVICDKPDWCRRTADGCKAACRRFSSSPRYGAGIPRRYRNGEPYGLFHLDKVKPEASKWLPSGRVQEPVPERGPDYEFIAAKVRRYEGELTTDDRAALAKHLMLPEWAIDAIPGLGCRRAKYMDRHSVAWAFPEVDAERRPIGISFRDTRGKKFQEPGGSRGLTIPTDSRNVPGFAVGPRLPVRSADPWDCDPLFIVEGASDVIAMSAAGLSAVGRPSNVGGVPLLAELLKDVPISRPIVVVGENDRKRPELGKADLWPGRAGAYFTAVQLAERLGRPVQWTMTPEKPLVGKDSRHWLTVQAEGSDRPNRWRGIGRDLRSKLLAGAATAMPGYCSFPERVQEMRCSRPDRPRLAGRPWGERAGIRAIAAFRCTSWRCDECRIMRRNRLLCWMFRCVLAWTDPARIPAEAAEVSTAPDTARCGPWRLYAALIRPERWEALNRAINRHCYKNYRAVEWCRVDVRPALSASVPPFNGLAPVECDDAMLVVAAFDHETDPPQMSPEGGGRGKRVDVFTPVTSDDCMRLLTEAMNCLPESPRKDEGGDEADSTRFVPVTLSAGWEMPEDEDGCPASGNWRREGRSGLDVIDTETATHELLAASAESFGNPLKPPKHLMGSAVWEDALLGGELASAVFSYMQEPKFAGPGSTPDDLVQRFRFWQKRLRKADEMLVESGTPYEPDFNGRIGPALQEVLDKHLPGLPPDNVESSIVDAVREDLLSASHRADIADIERAVRENRVDWPESIMPKKEKRKPPRQKIDHTRTEEWQKANDSIGR